MGRRSTGRDTKPALTRGPRSQASFAGGRQVGGDALGCGLHGVDRNGRRIDRRAAPSLVVDDRHWLPAVPGNRTHRVCRGLDRFPEVDDRNDSSWETCARRDCHDSKLVQAVDESEGGFDLVGANVAGGNRYFETSGTFLRVEPEQLVEDLLTTRLAARSRPKHALLLP